MGLFRCFINNARKPSGILGSMMLNRMNTGHAMLVDWGMSFLPELEPEKILDIGCGGGRNAAELMKRYGRAALTAIDYSPLSVKKAKEYNKREILAGRCTVREGNAAELSTMGERFGLVTAFETVYFWQDIESCFREVCGVLEPGGYFLIVHEADGIDEEGLKYEKIINGMRVYTADELSGCLKNAGFSKVSSFHHEQNPWISVIAEK